MKQFLYGILGALSVVSCHANSNTAQQPLQLIKYGAFIKTAVYSIAQEYGLFTAYGVNVTYLQVPNSTYSNDQLASGGYDVLLTAIDNVANNRWNLGRNFTALAQTDGGADIILAGIPSITNILQLKGKNLMVDSPISGFAYLLRKILAVNGLHLENGDYNFIVVGGTNLRYAALTNGTYNGTAVHATILTFPFTEYGLSLPAGQTLTNLARASDYVAPYSDEAVTVLQSSLTNSTFTCGITRFLSAWYDAERYLIASRAANNSKCVVAALQKQLNVSLAIAQKEYAAATDPVAGEATAGMQGNLTVDRIGLLNVIDLRTQFAGFPNISKNFDFAEAIVPGPGKIVDYAPLRAGIAQSRNLTNIKC